MVCRAGVDGLKVQIYWERTEHHPPYPVDTIAWYIDDAMTRKGVRTASSENVRYDRVRVPNRTQK